MKTRPKELFEAISREISAMHKNWVLFRHLFNREEDLDESLEDALRAGNRAYDVTGQSSELFFRFARFQMLRGAIQDLCRLCDRDDHGGKENLTLGRVLSDTDFRNQPALRPIAFQRKSYAYEIVRDKEGIWRLRNTLIAHFDLDTALGKTLPIDIDVVDQVDLATRIIVDFREILAAAREGRPYAPPDKMVESAWRGSADNLIATLARGLR